MPLTGQWTVDGFPERVTLLGRSFRTARWRQTRAGVVAQYREERARDSAHLLVLGDGTWKIEHTDDYNPDMRAPLRHFFADHPAGKVCKTVAGAVVLRQLLIFLFH